MMNSIASIQFMQQQQQQPQYTMPMVPQQPSPSSPGATVATSPKTTSDQDTQVVKSLQAELETQQDQLNSAHKILTCFCRRVPYNGEERGFIYVRRLGRTVNFEATRVPFLIDRLVCFYEQLGYPMQYLENVLGNCLKNIQQTGIDLEQTVDEVATAPPTAYVHDFATSVFGPQYVESIIIDSGQQWIY